MSQVAEKIVYHVFADGVDEFFQEEEEDKAWALYHEWCRTYSNVRLWSMIDDGEELEDQDCLAKQGYFPA